MRPEPGGMETCVKIQMDPALFTVDCDGCEERSFCGLRSKTLVGRYSHIMTRVAHVAWLYGAREIITGFRHLSAWELRGLVQFHRAVNTAHAAEVELKRKQEKR